MNNELQSLLDGCNVLADSLKVLHRLGGFYQCPKDSEGNRLGPLVGYAGTYENETGQKVQFVGDVYANLAKAEEWPDLLFAWSCSFPAKIFECCREDVGNLVLCAAPLGGMTWGPILSFVLHSRYTFPEKKVTAVKSDQGREKSEMVFSRHGIKFGDRVIICEDVCNNFSTTADLIAKIEVLGGQVVAIVCLLNRSVKFDDDYPYQSQMNPNETQLIPVVSLIRQAIPEYKQDDSEVVKDITDGNVIWKPKDKEGWAKLMQAMNS